jgi:hypothetical protein
MRAWTSLGARVCERDVWRARAHAGAKTIDGGQNGGSDTAISSQTKKGMDG